MTDLNALYPDDQPKRQSAPAPAPASQSRQPQREPDADALLYPDDQPKGAPAQRQAQRPSAADGYEPATLTYADQAPFDPAPLTSFFDQAALAAMQEGNRDHANEISQSGKAMVADMKAAGTPADLLKSALHAYHESASEGLNEDQQAEVAQATVAELQAEYGPTFERDLGAARALIEDLEKVTPGLIESLEATGAGNNPKLIRAAIKEAARRGYGRR